MARLCKIHVKSARAGAGGRRGGYRAPAGLSSSAMERISFVITVLLLTIYCITDSAFLHEIALWLMLL